MEHQDLAEVFLMLGAHTARLESIERISSQTSADVRSLLADFNHSEGASAARQPLLTWLGRASSALAAGAAGAWAGIHFGVK